ncbi:MAG: hypothetical protein KAV87_60940 [Desulfobacteraceae bacterium]|nr:hypothetical protein [Desulfobacteraceae bacterium]
MEKDKQTIIKNLTKSALNAIQSSTSYRDQVKPERRPVYFYKSLRFLKQILGIR